MLYLDANASLPLLPAVSAELTRQIGASDFGNPSSLHGTGQRGRWLIEAVRNQLRVLAEAESVVFTSGGTEANRLAVYSQGVPRIVFAGEHASLLSGESMKVGVTERGECDLESLERLLAQSEAPSLVSEQAVNNETGVIQPIAEVARMVKRHSGYLHCDLTQAIGKLPTPAWVDLDWDMATISGHKIGALTGVGALVIRDRLDTEQVFYPRALLTGGGQEQGLRSGTENIFGIISLGVALEQLADLSEQWQKVAPIRDQLEARLSQSGARVIGNQSQRVVNTSCVVHPVQASETMLIRFDLAGYAVGAGSACASGRTEPSHVLLAMGLPRSEASRALRISLPPTIGASEMAGFYQVWDQSLSSHDLS